MKTYVITAEVDDEWFGILGQITRYQEGFRWVEVDEVIKEKGKRNYEH